MPETWTVGYLSNPPSLVEARRCPFTCSGTWYRLTTLTAPPRVWSDCGDA